MASRGVDQFVMILTSDGSDSVYPRNPTGNLKIALKEAIDTSEEEWEVGLLGVNYPYNWVNIGVSDGVHLQYRTSEEPGVGEIKVEFPRVHCVTIKELVYFVNTKVGKELFSVDEFGRVVIKSSDDFFDIGMTYELMSIMGFKNRLELNIESYSRRAFLRRKLKEITREGSNLLDYVKEAKSLGQDRIGVLKLILGKVGEETDIKHFYLTENGGTRPVVDPMMTEEEKEKSLMATETELSAMMWMMQYAQDVIVEFEKKGPKMMVATMPAILNTIPRMYIYLNIIEPVEVNNEKVKVLKILNTRGKSFETTQEEYSNPMYLPVIKGVHTELEVLIGDDQGEQIPFQSGTLILTLHFRKAARQSFGRIRN